MLFPIDILVICILVICLQMGISIDILKLQFHWGNSGKTWTTDSHLHLAAQQVVLTQQNCGYCSVGPSLAFANGRPATVQSRASLRINDAVDDVLPCRYTEWSPRENNIPGLVI